MSKDKPQQTDQMQASTQAKSPRITEFSWGKVRVEGVDTLFKDVQLYPGGVQAWYGY